MPNMDGTGPVEKCIALPLEDGILCAHFGHCETFAIVTVVDNQITEIKEQTPPEHVPGLYPRWVASFGVTDVIAEEWGKSHQFVSRKQHQCVCRGTHGKSEALVRDFG